MSYPAYGLPPTPTRPTNAMAVAALISGVVSWILLPLFGGVAAVVLGHLALSQLKKTGEEGNGLAIGGLVLGYLNLLFSLVMVCVFGTAIIGCFAALFTLETVPDTGVTPTIESATPEPFPTT